MERFNALGRGAQLMLVGAVLFFINLFMPWQSYGGPFKEEIEAVGGDTTRTAFHGLGGWLLGLLTLVLIAWLVARLAAVEIPIPVSAAMTAGVLAFLILMVAVLKALVDDYSGWAAWVGIALAILIAVGAWLQIQESGGIETLKTEATSLGSSARSGTSTAGSDTAGAPAVAGTTAPPPAPEAVSEPPPPPPVDTEPEAPPETPPADRPA